MSSTRSVNPLHIKLRPSRRLLVLMSLLFAGALILLSLLLLPLLLKFMLAVLVIFAYVITLNRSGRIVAGMDRLPLFREPIQQLVWQQDGEWRLVTVSGQIIHARLLPSSTVSQMLVVLNFRLEDLPWPQRFRSLVLLSDAVNPDQLRQLRVRLLTEGLSQRHPRTDNAAV